MKRFIKSYFSYSRRQLRGIYVLFSLILLVFVFPSALNYFNKDKVWDHTEFKETIEKILRAKNNQASIQNTSKSEFFSFNPNSVSKEDLQKLGFTEKQITTFLKYRKAGGKFHTKEDLKKVYGITDDLYKTLYPYILINEIEKKSVFEENKDTIHFVAKKEWKRVDKTDMPINDIMVELNAADSIELIKIPGIGPSFAKRIISFRSFVGGFYNKDQLLEVFGFTPELRLKIEPFIIIDTQLIVKIELNHADFKTLNKHPYIEYSHTKNLMKYKELMGKFNSVDDIVHNHLMDSASYNKVKHYLFVQN